MTTLKINGKEVKSNGYFATNGQHYLVIEDETDLKAAKESAYEVLPIEKIEEDWNEYGGNYASITNWKTTTGYVGQAEMIFNERAQETEYFRELTVFEWVEEGDTNKDRVECFLNNNYEIINSQDGFTQYKLSEKFTLRLSHFAKKEADVTIYHSNGKQADITGTDKRYDASTCIAYIKKKASI
ncbi:hypothetical protein [Macrococcoides caseolyticum]|uniref:Uncharacterized protein n=1 Tax=Macrococcoides caseolyticum TaxID=69966 RepID=A0ACC9MTF6_9STAP|nr:hypothetical protein [Macrococcus caseolyticus]PKE39923.1 hypothetical protein CW675_03040 [Macrococcus caseolyticus]PKE57071.1 hypothetical protein CW682_02385 [Macrococcus caseolyticus]